MPPSGNTASALTKPLDVSVKRKHAQRIVPREAAPVAAIPKSETPSNTSHDVRTHLTAIIGMAELLGETKLSTEQRYLVSSVTRNANLLNDLINSILNPAGFESGLTAEAAIPPAVAAHRAHNTE